MYTIKCKELTYTECDFEVSSEDAEDAKAKFFQHGAEAGLHREKYHSATDEEKADFAKKLDGYLAEQSN